MNMIFQDAKDKYVTSVIIFGKAADHKLYVDEEMTVQVKEDVVLDAFLKGVLVVAVGDAFVRPASVNGNEVDVNGTTYEAEALVTE